MFTIKCLKDGMVIETRNGKMGLILNNKVIYEDVGFDDINDFTYNDDMTIRTDEINDDKELVKKLRDSDIVKVYMPIDVSDIRDLFNTDKLEVIYERVKDDSNKNSTTKDDIKIGDKVEVKDTGYWYPHYTGFFVTHKAGIDITDIAYFDIGNEPPTDSKNRYAVLYLSDDDNLCDSIETIALIQNSFTYRTYLISTKGLSKIN